MGREAACLYPLMYLGGVAGLERLPTPEESWCLMARPTDWPSPVYDVSLAQAMHDIGAGLRKWPKNPEKKRHHFVARFILANFASREMTGKERIVQLDKTTGEAVKVLPEEAASRRRFYAVESEESPHDNRIEDFLSLVEGYAAEPIRTMLERPTDLSEADRTTISLLLALQGRRTPYGIAEAGAAAEPVATAESRSEVNEFADADLRPRVASRFPPS